MLKDGIYETKCGSEVTINGSSCQVVFDWFEEEACDNCEFDDIDFFEHTLNWTCDICEGGQAKLYEKTARDI